MLVLIIKKELKGREQRLKQKRWFLLLDGQVTGPHDDSEIQNHIDKAKSSLIWGRGQSEWLPPEAWKLAVKALADQQSLEQQTSRQWKMRVGHKELTPMGFDELIENLKDYTDLTPVRIWSEGFDDWKEVFQVQKIADELGVSRRKHLRVPVMGSMKASTEAGEINAKIISISEGGIGVNNAKSLQIGENFSAKLSSPNLFMDLTCKMEVVYVGADGYAGLRFLSLPSDAKSVIVEYVKKFQQK
ncbi:MAG: PilZ domain-containing protein [Pseudobdellovibrionaceae bacterium]